MNHAGGLSASADLKKNITNCRCQCAIAYHQLHQVHFCQQVKGQGEDIGLIRGHLLGLFYGLAAVNLAEASGQNLPGNFKSHAYALLSIRLRYCMPRTFSFLARFYMFKAKQRQQKNENIDANLSWLLSKNGQQFYNKGQWTLGQNCSELTSEPEDLNPLSLLSRYFR